MESLLEVHTFYIIAPEMNIHLHNTAFILQRRKLYQAQENSRNKRPAEAYADYETEQLQHSSPKRTRINEFCPGNSRKRDTRDKRKRHRGMKLKFQESER